MVTTLAPEPGGESSGILRLDLSLPVTASEALALADWLDAHGFHDDAEDVCSYVAGGAS